MGQVKDLSGKNFAVIVDEAHSSQSGRSAGNLRGVLGNKTLNAEQILAAAETEDAQTPEPESMEDLIIAEAKSRGRQPNISFYAFTATPKHKNPGEVRHPRRQRQTTTVPPLLHAPSH